MNQHEQNMAAKEAGLVEAQSMDEQFDPDKPVESVGQFYQRKLNERDREIEQLRAALKRVCEFFGARPLIAMPLSRITAQELVRIVHDALRGA